MNMIQQTDIHQANVTVDIIVYEQPNLLCVEAFTTEGRKFLQHSASLSCKNYCTLRELLEQSGLRYEIMGRPS